MPTIQNRRATKSQWEAINPVLAAGEVGVEIGTNKFKVGNGLSPWNALDYFVDESELDGTYATYDRIRMGGTITPRNPRPLVVFSMDDGPAEDKTIVKPILDAKGVKGVFCVTTGSIPGTSSPTGKATLSELLQWEREGHEIMSHSVSHANMSTATLAEVITDLTQSKAKLTDAGITVSGYCWPYNASNTAARLEARKLYDYAIGGNGHSIQPLGQYSILRRTLGTGTTFEQMKAHVDDAVLKNKLLIFLIHAGYDLDVAAQTQLEQTIDYIKTTSAEIVTMRQAIELVGNVFDSGDYDPGSTTPFMVVGGNGQMVSSNSGVTIFMDQQNMPPTKPPKDFLPGHVYYTEISAVQGAWPGGSVSGTVVTDALEQSYWAFTTQTYYAGSKIFRRMASTADTWQGWTEVGSGGFSNVALNAHTAAMTPDSFTPGRIYHCDLNATGTAVGWPELGVVASVTTNAFNASGSVQYITQTYTTRNGTWVRKGLGATVWSSWVGGAIALKLSATAPSSAPNTFAAGITLTEVPNPGSTGPTAEPGLLVTKRYVDATYDGYTFQEFNTYGQSDGFYVRTSNTAGTGWLAWRKVTTTPLT